MVLVDVHERNCSFTYRVKPGATDSRGSSAAAIVLAHQSQEWASEDGKPIWVTELDRVRKESRASHGVL